MSNTFYIPTAKQPSYQDILAALDLPDVVAPNSPVGWPMGTTHIHREGVSTRSTEITYEHGAFEVRILALASAEDYDLALRLVEQLASQTGSMVRYEDNEEFPPEELRDRFNERWILDMIEAQPAIIAHWAREQQKTVTIKGPVRDFHIGPRLFAELEAEGAPAIMAERLVQAIRVAQYKDLSNYHAANVMEVSARDKSQSITMCVWSPDTALHFPGVEFLSLVPDSQADGLLFIPYESLPKLAAGRFSWLDEEQSLVEPFSSDEWPELLRRATQFAVEPFQRKKKWWRSSR